LKNDEYMKLWFRADIIMVVGRTPPNKVAAYGE